MKFDRNSWYFKCYYRGFNFIAKERIKAQDVDLRDIHANLVMVLSTAPLMWGYAALAWFTISSPIPGIVGTLCSLLHTTAPFLFRYSKNAYFITNISLLAGVIHQATFAYFTEGFMSHILIWYNLIPVLSGLISGMRGAFTWLIITVMISLTYFGLHLSDYAFPNLITPTGHLIAHILLVFGWIFISSSMVIVYASLRENTEKLLQEQSAKIDELFRVLFHDLANPLGRLSIGLSIAKRSLPEAVSNRGLEIATAASNSMLEITQNIRRMYAVSKGKENIVLILLPLAEALETVKQDFTSDLNRKNLKLTYDAAHLEKVAVMVDPVSFNNQVLGNIISNAIKFSPPGGEITIEAVPHGPHFFQVRIKDQGIGIPKLLLADIFDLNKKTNRTGTQGETGTGYGMHIIKTFVEIYGGTIEVESTEDESGKNSGTTVKLNLKCK